MMEKTLVKKSLCLSEGGDFTWEPFYMYDLLTVYISDVSATGDRQYYIYMTHYAPWQ